MREAAVCDTAQICYRINDKWRELCGSRGEQFIPSSNEKPFRRLDVWTLTGFRPGVHPTSIKYLPYSVRFREIRTDTALFCKASANKLLAHQCTYRVWPVIHCTNGKILWNETKGENTRGLVFQSESILNWRWRKDGGMKSHPARTFLEENQDFSINNFDKRREYLYILEKIFNSNC